MSKFDEALDLYQQEMKVKLHMEVDEQLLRGVAKALGPSIYHDDASKVSCSDKKELSRVKENFLMGKLGLKETPVLKVAIYEVCRQMGQSNRNKYRAIFYYLLVKKFKKEYLFID